MALPLVVVVVVPSLVVAGEPSLEPLFVAFVVVRSLVEVELRAEHEQSLVVPLELMVAME